MAKESAYTSGNRVAAGLKAFEFGKQNLDYGGGEYDKGVAYLAERGTFNVVVDPFNRDEIHNKFAMMSALGHPTETVTFLNVMNVISKKERTEALELIKRFINTQKRRYNVDTVLIMQVHEGDKTGKPSRDGLTQTNMRLADYIPEIQAVFPKWEVQRSGKYLTV